MLVWVWKGQIVRLGGDAHPYRMSFHIEPIEDEQ